MKSTFYFILFFKVTFDGDQEFEVSFYPKSFKFPHSTIFYTGHRGNLGKLSIQITSKSQFYPENDQFANVAVLFISQFDKFTPFYNKND